MTKYNDTFTMIVCSAAHLKTSYDEILDAVMHLGLCSCHATLCCTLLCFSVIESLVLCNPCDSFGAAWNLATCPTVYITFGRELLHIQDY